MEDFRSSLQKRLIRNQASRPGMKIFYIGPENDSILRHNTLGKSVILGAGLRREVPSAAGSLFTLIIVRPRSHGQRPRLRRRCSDTIALAIPDPKVKGLRSMGAKRRALMALSLSSSGSMTVWKVRGTNYASAAVGVFSTGSRIRRA